LRGVAGDHAHQNDKQNRFFKSFHKFKLFGHDG
jgi:hypothetical protein